MMTQHEILQKARARLQELECERIELETFIRTFERLLANGVPPRPTTSTSPVKASRREIVDATLETLARVGRPMSLGEIFEDLTQRGIQIGGKVPRNNLGAMLSADGRICTQPNRGWWFVDEEPPRQLDELDDDEYEKGLTDEVRPSLTNGAAGSYPVVA